MKNFFSWREQQNTLETDWAAGRLRPEGRGKFFSWKEGQNTLETDCAAGGCGAQDEASLLLKKKQKVRA
jgi:hypothetical protein